MRRRLFVLDRHLTFVSTFNRGDADFHGRFILIGTDLVERLTARHALRHHLWVEQNLPNPIPRSTECIASLNLQNDSPSRLGLVAMRATSKLLLNQADYHQKP